MPGSVVVVPTPSPIVVVAAPVVVVAQDVEPVVTVAEEEQRRAALSEAMRERTPEVVAALVDEEALLDEAPPLAELDHPRSRVVVRDVRQVLVLARVGLDLVHAEDAVA